MEAASVNVTNKHKFYLGCFHICFTKGQWSRSAQRRDDAAISCDWNGMTSSSMNPIFRKRACAMFTKYPPFKVVDFVVGKMQNFP